MTISSTLFFRNLDHFASFIAATMRTGAVRKLRLVTIGALGAAGDFQMVMSPACGGALLGVSSFWIWHLVFSLVTFNVNLLERRPTVVHQLGFATALYQVTILTAYRANPLAILAANPLHRHAEQNLLPQNIF
jgi:hypothetical protein